MVNKVGLIGWPVEHSISPNMHNAAFWALGMTDWSYELVPIPPDIVGKSLRTLRDEGGFVGVNVTVPLKQSVMPYIKPDERARAIGAVNTIDFRDGSGTNTDVMGFLDDLKANGINPAGMNVLVLGAGGAARAAIYGLARSSAKVTVVNRTIDRAREMVTELVATAGIQNVTVEMLDDAAEQPIDLIVNCTSVGMWPNVEESPWISGVPFPRGVTLYEMVYRPESTMLMHQAISRGGHVIGGLGMLVRQGAAAFELWTGKAAPLDVMFAAARQALVAKSK